MTFLIFIIILGILILVHEFGHFLVAKKAGVKVEEFGFGYPPRALSIGKRWGTLFSLNWVPFGGFVKIFGEDYEKDFSSPKNQKCLASATSASTLPRRQTGRNPSADGYPCISDLGMKKNLRFTEVSKKWQAAILAAGVAFNIIFAWLLFSLGFIIGLPMPVENNFGADVKNPALTVVDILQDSPAQNAGLKAGDKIRNISLENGERLKSLEPEKVSSFIENSFSQILITIDRGGEILDFKIKAEEGLAGEKKIIGINMNMVGTLSLPIHKAFVEGAKITSRVTYLTVWGIFDLIGGAIKGKADISQVAGPIGIIGLVGDASRLGLIYLITFTGLISINLAVINLIPFPALDGGRLLFVAVEAVIKRPINPKIAQNLNSAGFAILIILMFIVTYRDILKLF